MLKDLILRLLIPDEVSDVSSVHAGLAGFDQQPDSPTGPAVDTDEFPFASSAEAALMVA